MAYESGPGQLAAHRRCSQERAALLVFIAAEVAAFGLILVLGRNRWFFNDDWDFLAQRTAGEVNDLFRPHYEHWITLPLLAYRFLWWLFGARSYLPYQALVAVMHLTTAALLRVVMRRAGVGPWIATAVAVLFAAFGSGYDNLIAAFQITFVGSLVFGLTHLLLADHDGPRDRRDWGGMLAGLAGLMCSLVALPMIALVGLSSLIRNGPRRALFHVVPLSSAFLVWWVLVRPPTYSGDHDLGNTAEFVQVGFFSTFDALGQVCGAGILISIILTVGMVFTARTLSRTELRRRTAAPASLLVGAVMFLVVTGYGRSVKGLGPALVFGPEHASESRYLHVVAALILPAVAVAADALTRRRRLLGPVVLALLVVGVPGNIKKLADQTQSERETYVGYRQMLLSVAHLPRVDELPQELSPDPYYAKDATVGWLRASASSGKLPKPDPPVQARQASTELLLVALVPTAMSIPHQSCVDSTGPVRLVLERGDVLAVGFYPVRIQYVPHNATASSPVDFGAELLPPWYPNYPVVRRTAWRTVLGPLELIMTPKLRDSTVSVCLARNRMPTDQPDPLSVDAVELLDDLPQ